jgi:hypothetical protein
MAMLRTRFETANVAPSQSRELIPAGKYIVQIVASEFKDTSTGGQMLVLEMDILDGPHQGRKMWDRLNLENANPKAVEIAEETLRDICLAIGRQGCSDSEELHCKPMTATIKVRPAGNDKKGVYREAANEIGGYKPMEHRPVQSIPRAAAPVAVAQPVAAPAAANAPAAAPWRRAAG